MKAKYRINEQANSRFRIWVLAGGAGDNWVRASESDFDTIFDAERGLNRIVAAKTWLYDEHGNKLSAA
jgi:hypothetical protein